MGYYIVKKYFVPEPIWLKAPHWNPIKHNTWQEARDAYIEERWSNPLALGVHGLSPRSIDIVFDP